ncbi:hypothetical protein PT974_02396 [Cladobotryum mycophilum]|uniref:Polysaccharide lyase family 20 protein n=1 Tax=Cladobotryum mycophilum TaxID=491253 RepID=A0ABR0SXZ1_9HYPO
MVAIKSLLATAAALLPLASAAPSFYNDGHLNGWDAVIHENKGSVAEDKGTFYKGGSAIKVTQTYTPGYTGRYHSEVDHNRGYKRGDTLFYGFMFRLAPDWQFQPQSYNLAQFIANRPGAGCDDDDWMPSTMIWIQNNQLNTRIVNGHYRKPNCGRNIKGFPNIATISAGQWHKVIIQAHWASDNSGFLKTWLDGKLVHQVSNIATTIDDDSIFNFHVGLYANSWHDEKHMAGSQGFRQVWYDEIAIGNTMDDVDPDKH